MKCTPQAMLILVLTCGVLRYAGATPSTIITIPSTDILSEHTLHVDVDSMFTVGRSTNNTLVVSAGSTYGLAERLEVGFDYLVNTPSPLVGNAKYRINHDQNDALVIGGWLLGDAATTGANQLYLLGSHRSRTGERVALGVALGNARVMRDTTQLWLSWDKQLDEEWWLGADFASGRSAISGLNIGLSHTLGDQAGVILGYNRYNDRSAGDTLTIQFDVNFN